MPIRMPVEMKQYQTKVTEFREALDDISVEGGNKSEMDARALSEAKTGAVSFFTIHCYSHADRKRFIGMMDQMIESLKDNDHTVFKTLSREAKQQKEYYTLRADKSMGLGIGCLIAGLVLSGTGPLAILLYVASALMVMAYPKHAIEKAAEFDALHQAIQPLNQLLNPPTKGFGKSA